jgi:hypothetical protein
MAPRHKKTVFGGKKKKKQLQEKRLRKRGVATVEARSVSNDKVKPPYSGKVVGSLGRSGPVKFVANL